MSMSDDFSSRFDSISVENAHLHPGAVADAPIENENGPGFTLLNDAGGRFAIERETGIITVLHDETLATDAGAVFTVRLRCVEYSGLSYDQDLKLRVTGRVPLIVGDEANDALWRLAHGPLDVAPIRRVSMALAEPAIAPAADVAMADWSEFAAFRAHGARRPLTEPSAFGALTGALPSVDVSANLALVAAPPAPAPAHARWAI